MVSGVIVCCCCCCWFATKFTEKRNCLLHPAASAVVVLIDFNIIIIVVVIIILHQQLPITTTTNHSLHLHTNHHLIIISPRLLYPLRHFNRLPDKIPFEIAPNPFTNNLHLLRPLNIPKQPLHINHPHPPCLLKQPLIILHNQLHMLFHLLQLFCCQ